MVVRIIQALYVFRLSITIGSFQAHLTIMVLLEACLDEEAIRSDTYILNIHQISLSYSNYIREINPTLIYPPSSPTYLNLCTV